MADLKPPKLVGAGEKATLIALLQYQRESVVRKIEGLSDEEARRSPVPTGTSLLWLVKHLTMAELLWVAHRFAGRSFVALPANDLETTDTVASVVDGYRAAWTTVDMIVEHFALDDRCQAMPEDDMVDLRWVLAHLLEETARHAGHADIIRELIDGRTGR